MKIPVRKAIPKMHLDENGVYNREITELIQLLANPDYGLKNRIENDQVRVFLSYIRLVTPFYLFNFLKSLKT